MKIRRIVKFEIEGGHDVEFVPTIDQTWEVYFDGLYVDEIPRSERPCAARAIYYWELHGTAPVDLPEAPVEEAIVLQ